MVDWERTWRGNGVIAAVLFVIPYVIYGSQPKVGASADKLVSFYDGDSTADGAYSRFGPTLAMLAWIAVVSGFLRRRYSAVKAPERIPVPAS